MARMTDDGGAGGGAASGMAKALLGEIAALLAKLDETGEGGVIDLKSLPMTAADRIELDLRLGRGEVKAELAVSGTSEIWETGYAGVWWVRHLGGGGKIAAEAIAIAPVPEILMAQAADVHEAALRLKRDMSGQASPAEEGHHG
jgi:hydrogenase-1 operon protein HyaF